MVDAKTARELKKAIIDSTKKHQMEIFQKAARFPELQIESAQEKKIKAISAADEIDYLAKIVEDDVANLEKKLRQHIKSQQNPQGILNKEFSKYSPFFHIERPQLKKLLNKEVEAWAINLQSVKASMDSHLLKLQRLIEEQQQALEEHVFMFDRKGPLKTPYDLKKLAVFGAQNVDD